MKGISDIAMYQNEREEVLYKSSMEHLNAARVRIKELEKQQEKLLEENKQLRDGYRLDLVSHEYMILDPIIDQTLLCMNVIAEIETVNRRLVETNHELRKEKHSKIYSWEKEK